MKIAFITGASSGIGEATAEVLSTKGYNLILCSRSKERLYPIIKKLENQTRIFTLEFDVSNHKQVKDAINSLPEEWKAIDVLVNNAGNAHGLDTIEDGDVNDWDMMIDINTKGLLYVSKAVIPLMTSRGKGHIVNISSIAGKETYINGVVYCASKSAVESISNGMRQELVPKGIKLTNIAPGAVETSFSEVRFKGDKDRAKSIYTGYKALQAIDIANSIAFCVTQPDHVQIADMTIFPKAQSTATSIIKE